jgi:hypothetical protein
MKNQFETCVQCGKQIGAALTDEQREEVAEAARMAAGG